jgi:hypothetical protein
LPALPVFIFLKTPPGPQIVRTAATAAEHPCCSE